MNSRPPLRVRRFLRSDGPLPLFGNSEEVAQLFASATDARFALPSPRPVGFKIRIGATIG